jgi:hypothetical protein
MATFKELLDEEIAVGMVSVASSIEEYARNNHRFESQTGVLQENTYSEWNESEQRIENYVPAHVDYAEYVINGNKTWAEDSYIDEAIQANQGEIDDAISQAEDRAWDRYASQD